MEFRKGGGRRRKEDWRWHNEEIETVKEFKYLGYFLQQNNWPENHWRYTKKKARAAIGQLWGIPRRLPRENATVRLLSEEHSYVRS
jgi:hypothetical protein